ncbi:Zn(2)-C7 fungal-type transcription factor [Pseudohyphozyma bogoriensis]|nr:Zn(2)-C7 fungal-type transcription factor [Pseudohyphozyma bogoriensis]
MSIQVPNYGGSPLPSPAPIGFEHHQPVASTSAATSAAPEVVGKSCSTCRLRRVKCVRTNPDDKECLGCIKKGIVCVPMKLEKRKVPARTGKRIEEARARFGEHARTPSPKDGGVVALRRDPVDDKLGGVEMERALASTLITARAAHETMAAANFRAAEMDELTRVSFYTLLALSARVTDHMGIVGPDAPKLGELAVYAGAGTRKVKLSKRTA